MSAHAGEAVEPVSGELRRAAPVDGWASDSFVPLRDRAAEWDLRLQMVARARQFLYVTTYFVEHDDYGLRFLDALSTAARRGVKVFLGLDSLGQRLGNYVHPVEEQRRLQALLQAAVADGVQLAVYRPRTALQRRFGAGHHVKFQFSEQGSLLLGSSNVSARSYEGWHEFSAVLDGPIVVRALQDLITMFALPEQAHRGPLAVLQGLARDAAPAAHRFDYLFHDPNVGRGVLHPLVVGPNPITDRLIEAIDGAARSVRLSSFHCKPTPSLADALIRAARRGVCVELFHSHREALTESELPWLSAAFDYRRFLRAGLRIFESRRGEHSKIFVVDQRWGAFGSYNAEHAAHERLAEVLVTSEDPRIVGALDAVLDQMAAAADVVPVLRESHREGLKASLGWLLWRPMRRWL